jgi:hypothetical protein
MILGSILGLIMSLILSSIFIKAQVFIKVKREDILEVFAALIPSQNFSKVPRISLLQISNFSHQIPYKLRLLFAASFNLLQTTSINFPLPKFSHPITHRQPRVVSPEISRSKLWRIKSE